MMRRIIHISLWFTWILAVPAAAQNYAVVPGNSFQKLNRIDGKLTGVVYHINALANSNFFLQEDWANGVIELEDGVKFDSVRIRYNARTDALVAYNSQLRTLFIVDKKKVKSFSIPTGNNLQHFVKLPYDGFNSGERYFREIYNGAVQLLAFHFVDEIKVSPFVDSQGIMRDTEYRFAQHYFIHNKNLGFVRVQKKRRSFLKLFPERKKEIRKLFRKNHILAQDEQGMIQAIQLLEEAGILK